MQSNLSLQQSVDPSLHHITGDLVHIKNRLLETKQAQNVKDATELRKFQYKLDELESKYKPGPDFIWGGSLKENKIPKGQAVLNELVDECHDIIDSIIEIIPEKVASDADLAKRERSKKTEEIPTKSSNTSTSKVKEQAQKEINKETQSI